MEWIETLRVSTYQGNLRRNQQRRNQSTSRYFPSFPKILFSVEFASGFFYLIHSWNNWNYWNEISNAAKKDSQILIGRWSTTSSKWILSIMEWFSSIETQPNHIPRIDVRTTELNWNCPSVSRKLISSEPRINNASVSFFFFFGGCILMLMKFIRICLQIWVWLNCYVKWASNLIDIKWQRNMMKFLDLYAV